MNDVEQLRAELVKFIKRKFYSRPNIADLADDIVNQAFLSLLQSHCYDEKNRNFGYLSVICIRIAYKLFQKSNLMEHTGIVSNELVCEDDFVADILHNEDTKLILNSLDTLRAIEKIVISERYYKGFSFREISERHDINLNTILSHHRRALEKLRPKLSKYFEHDKRSAYYEKINTKNRGG